MGESKINGMHKVAGVMLWEFESEMAASHMM